MLRSWNYGMKAGINGGDGVMTAGFELRLGLVFGGGWGLGF